MEVYKYEWENIQYFTGELTASVSRGGKGGYESHIYMNMNDRLLYETSPNLSSCSFAGTLKKILEREDQYLFVARRTFTNFFLGVAYLNPLRAVPDLTQLSLESIYL